MKKIIATCLLLLVASPLFANTAATKGSGSVEASVRASWNLDAKPLDIVHTLDNKKVFILGDDNRVHVYSAEGVKLGTIPVDKGVAGIDIAPRGEMLYLIDQDKNTFSSLTVSFTTTIDVTGSPFLGEANAPVVLAVFSDFQ